VAADFTYAPEAPSPLDLPQQLANGMLFGTIRFKIASANHVVCREWMAENGPRLIDDADHTIMIKAGDNKRLYKTVEIGILGVIGICDPTVDVCGQANETTNTNAEVARWQDDAWKSTTHGLQE